MTDATTTFNITEILGEDRMNFTPLLFGPEMFLQGERCVFEWMRRLCADYNGGYWKYFAVSNGAYYMAPARDGKMRLTWPLNWSDETVSPDAAGIVATLFALNNAMGAGADDCLVKNYYALSEYAMAHPEAPAIFRLIN